MSLVPWTPLLVVLGILLLECVCRWFLGRLRWWY